MGVEDLSIQTSSYVPCKEQHILASPLLVQIFVSPSLVLAATWLSCPSERKRAGEQ